MTTCRRNHRCDEGHISIRDLGGCYEAISIVIVGVDNRHGTDLTALATAVAGNDGGQGGRARGAMWQPSQGNWCGRKRTS